MEKVLTGEGSLDNGVCQEISPLKISKKYLMTKSK